MARKNRRGAGREEPCLQPQRRFAASFCDGEPMTQRFMQGFRHQGEAPTRPEWRGIGERKRNQPAGSTFRHGKLRGLGDIFTEYQARADGIP